MKRKRIDKRHEEWKQDKRWLYQLFLRSIIRTKPKDMALGRFLDIVFGVKYREIAFYECLSDVRLYGSCWGQERKRIKASHRKLIENFKQGQNACIRIDMREAIVTIEGKHGCIDIPEERWNNEYKHLFRPLEKIDRTGHRDDIPGQGAS